MSTADRQKWDARYAGQEAGPRPPAPFLASLDEVLPRAGRALDVAGGAGRNGLWLARRGLAVAIVDVSPVGLALAATAAMQAALRVETSAMDLEEQPLPAGPFEVIVCVDYLRRELFASFAAALASGGLLVFTQPTRSNLTRNPHPSAAYLLEDGELPRLLLSTAPALEIVRYDEGWFAGGAPGELRHEARLLARKRP